MTDMADKGPTHDGNTVAAWTLACGVMLAFLIGTIAVCTGNWLVFWIGGVGLAVVSVIAGVVLSSMGYGKRVEEPVEATTAA